MSTCCPHRHCCVHRDGQHLRLCQLHPPGAGVLEGESPSAAREIDFLCHSSANSRSDKGLSRPRSQWPVRWKEGENLQPALSSDLHTHTVARARLQLRTHTSFSLTHTIKKINSTHLQAHSRCLGAVNNSMPLQAHRRCLEAVGHRFFSSLTSESLSLTVSPLWQ